MTSYELMYDIIAIVLIVLLDNKPLLVNLQHSTPHWKAVEQMIVVCP